MTLRQLPSLLALYAVLVFASPLALRDDSPPSVLLDAATIIGKANGTVVEYLGIPSAQPPYVAMLLVFD